MKCFSVKSSVQSQVVCVRSSVGAGGRSENLGVPADLIRLLFPGYSFPEIHSQPRVSGILFLRHDSSYHQQYFYYQRFSTSSVRGC